jgi:hypothetical protein
LVSKKKTHPTSFLFYKKHWFNQVILKEESAKEFQSIFSNLICIYENSTNPKRVVPENNCLLDISYLRDL